MAYEIEILQEVKAKREISSRKLIVTSDHHVPGDRKNGAADFDQEKAEKFIWFQKDYVKRDLHIINGDFFEGWQYEGDDILRENKDITRLLFRGNVVFTKGNHDGDILEGLRRKRRLPVYRGHWTSNRGRVLVRHGHAADPNNREDAAWWGKFWTKVVAGLERLKIPADSLWSWITGLGLTPSKIDDGKFNAQRLIYTEFSRFFFTEYDFDCVVFGHTHRPSLETEEINKRNRIFANTGTWTKGNWGSDADDTFVEIAGNSVRLGRVV